MRKQGQVALVREKTVSTFNLGSEFIFRFMFFKPNLQILVRLAGKHVFSLDGDVFCQHVACGNIDLGPRALVLLVSDGICITF